MSIAENIAQVRANIEAACREAGRDPGEIVLVGASKMNDAAACREAIAAGIDALGENRVQEMTAKLADNAYEGAPLHDPCAVAGLLRPDLFTMKDLYVEVETEGEYCRGATVGAADGWNGHAANARCLLDVDRAGFVDLLVEAVHAYDGWEVRI